MADEKSIEVTQELPESTGVTPELVNAGVSVFLWWKSDDFSRWFETHPGTAGDLEVLVRAMWSAMQAARSASGKTET